jgi:hypothetical protein
MDEVVKVLEGAGSVEVTGLSTGVIMILPLGKL